MTDQPIPPADEQVLQEMLDSRRKQLASCERMLELLQPEWDRFEKRDGSHDTYVARDYAEHTSAARRHRKEISALEFALTRPSPVVDGLSAELAALVETGTALPVHGQPYRTFELDEPLRDRIRTALAMRPAPETTASDDVVEALAAAVGRFKAAEADCPANKQFLGDKPCPKCSALSNEGCRETTIAAFAVAGEAKVLLANLPKPTEQATSPAPDAVLRDEAFCAAVWDALKADTNDLRKQQRILNAFRAALASPASTAEGEGE